MAAQDKKYKIDYLVGARVMLVESTANLNGLTIKKVNWKRLIIFLSSLVSLTKHGRNSMVELPKFHLTLQDNLHMFLTCKYLKGHEKWPSLNIFLVKQLCLLGSI